MGKLKKIGIILAVIVFLVVVVPAIAISVAMHEYQTGDFTEEYWSGDLVDEYREQLQDEDPPKSNPMP